MTSRRSFIHAGAAIVATGAIGSVVTSPLPDADDAAGPAARGLAIHGVVVDQRFDESVEFGRHLALLGAEFYGMVGDVTDVWYSRLYPLWKQGGIAIAGLTGSGVLFCLERLAWDHRLRVVYRGYHQLIADGRVEHGMLGGADWSILQQAAKRRRSGWPAAVAASIASVGSPRTAVPTNLALRPVAITDAENRTQIARSTLFSWLIAPPARV